MPRFTPNRIGKPDKTSYPELTCKAAACKIILHWLAQETLKASSSGSADTRHERQLLATCTWAHAELFFLMDAYPRFMTAEQSDRFAEVGYTSPSIRIVAQQWNKHQQRAAEQRAAKGGKRCRAIRAKQIQSQ